MTNRRWHTALPALTTLAGVTLVISTGRPAAIGATLAITGVITYALCAMHTWITDASTEKLRLRDATEKADEARIQASTAQAIGLAERERGRHEADEVRRTAAEQIAAAQERAEQAEINSAQRALEAERLYQEEAMRTVTEETERLRREAEQERAALMAESYERGAIDALEGRLDAILDAPRTVIHLDDHRPPAAPPGTVGAQRPS